MAVGNLIKGGVAAVAVGAGVFGVGVASDQDDTTREDSGAIVEEGGLGAFVMKEGDCLNWPVGVTDAMVDEAAEIESVQGVPCSQPHEAEVYALYDVDHDAFPGEQAIADESFSGCRERFSDFVGSDYDTDFTYDISTLYPSFDTWTYAGDREVVCTVVLLHGGMMTDSAQGAGAL